MRKPMRALSEVGVGRLVGRVVVVRGEDRVPPLVVARVDDQVHRLLDPLRGLLRAEVVEHEQVRFHHRPEDVHLGRADQRVVGAADHPQQIARVVEEPARPRVRITRRSTATARCVLPIPGGPMRQSPFVIAGNSSAKRFASFTAPSSFSLGYSFEGFEIAARYAAECALHPAAAP